MTDKKLLRRRLSRLIDLLTFITMFSYFLSSVWVVLETWPAHRYVYFAAGLICAFFFRIFFLETTYMYKKFKNERL
jgi:hypothetical protein